MNKVYTRFQTKTAQEPNPLGRHIPIWLIQGTESIRQVMIRFSYIMLGFFFTRFTEAKHLASFKRFSEHFPGKYFFPSEKIKLKHS